MIDLNSFDHYAARTQKAILCEVDNIEDDELRNKIRRVVLDQVELFNRRVQEDVARSYTNVVQERIATDKH
jgi:hypothetical protein